MDPIFSLIERTPAFAVLSSDIGGGRLGHAYLFAGDEVSAEAIMLLGAARALCPEGGCQKCATCRRILAGIHPDVLSFPEGGKYTAEGMEALIAEIYRRPTEGEKKFLLLKGADSMNLTCQNKFLKTLEEPPGDCHLFLGAAREDALLPTVRSRVRRLEIPPFSAEQLLPFARAVCRSPEEAELFAALGQGSPSEVRKLAEGRGRELFELASPNRNVRSFGERAAMNTPVQGTAADIIKLAMVQVARRLEEGGYRARLILQVHDELVVECPLAEADEVSALVQSTMESVVSLKVPLLAEVSRGSDWDQAH